MAGVLAYIGSFFTRLWSATPGAVSQGMIWGIMAIGLFITFKILDYADLTVDGSMALGGAVCVMLFQNGWNICFALVIAILAGMLAGLVTGVFHTMMGIPAILSGILTQMILYSVNLWTMGFHANQSYPPMRLNELVCSSRYVKNWTIQNPLLIAPIFIAVIILLLYLFFGTELGSALRATGSNENMARAQGINTKISKILGLMLSNGLVALSSALYSQYGNTVDVKMGQGAIVIGLAAVIIGEVVFNWMRRNFALSVLAVALGAIVYYIAIQIVLTLGLNTNLLKMFSALVVAIFLAIPYWKGKISARNAGKQKEDVKNA